VRPLGTPHVVDGTNLHGKEKEEEEEEGKVSSQFRTTRQQQHDNTTKYQLTTYS